ncbi:MCA1, partial [Symbiodinium necroappetens]
GLDWLVAEAQPGDALLLHYSGHGGREPAEEGGYHETLVPLDFETAGMLRDTELFERLVKRLPEGCRLTCILDSCHSAGALNLPYIFVGTED